MVRTQRKSQPEKWTGTPGSKIRRVAEEYGLPFLGAVPLDPLLVELTDSGRVEDYENNVFAAVMEPLTEKYQTITATEE